MNDILNREIPTGALVVGMIISRDSDGMRFGVYNGKSVDFIRHGRYLTRSIPSNLYLITSPTKEELEVKQKIVSMVEANDKAKEEAEKAKRALKRIPKKDLIIGEYYEDDIGRQFYYLGKGKVEAKTTHKYHSKINEGYLYLTPHRYSSDSIVFTEVEYSKSLRKIVKTVDKPEFFTLDLSSLNFTVHRGGYYETTYAVTLEPSEVQP